MRMSRLFNTTLREAPSEAEIASHRLLLKAGFIQPLGAGIFSYLHLAQRAMKRIKGILREEMNALDGQEITMPIVHPANLWKETGRWHQIDEEMAHFKDRAGHDMVLATHAPRYAWCNAGISQEAVVAELARRGIQSYRQLPQLLYQIQTKFRDETRPRAGLIRAREFTMLDSYSLDRDREGLDQQYQRHYQAYFRIFKRCGLPVRAVKSDAGLMREAEAHEFVYLTPVGEDTFLFCTSCDYAANQQIARFKTLSSPPEALTKLEKVATPDVTSIAALANFLEIPPSRIAKAVFLVAEQSASPEALLVFAVLRGDMNLNELKLANALGRAGHSGIKNLRPARDEEILAVGAVPGYASPIGINRENVLVVVDDLIPSSPNLVAGANQSGYHLLNTNLTRDYEADITADLSQAEEGALCPVCEGTLKAQQGIEVGNIVKLGSHYSKAMDVTYLDEEGKAQPVVMGSYGITVGRLLACVAEEHHDEMGLIWPVSVAPYPIHLVCLPSKDGAAEEAAEAFYQQLIEAGLEPLFDDRNERAGVKFNDADLIGLPLRITVAHKSLQSGGVEFKRRDEETRQIVSAEDAISVAVGILDQMERGI